MGILEKIGDGIIGPLRWTRFKLHTMVCEGCRMAAERMRLIVRALEAMPREMVPYGFAEELSKRLYSEKQNAFRVSAMDVTKTKSHRKRNIALLAGGILFGIVGIGVALLTRLGRKLIRATDINKGKGRTSMLHSGSAKVTGLPG